MLIFQGLLAANKICFFPALPKMTYDTSMLYAIYCINWIRSRKTLF